MLTDRARIRRRIIVLNVPREDVSDARRVLADDLCIDPQGDGGVSVTKAIRDSPRPLCSDRRPQQRLRWGLIGRMVTLPAARESLLVRVEFSKDDAWQQAKAAAMATNDDGFRAYLHPVDDPSNEGASWEDLVRAVPDSPDGPDVMFVVDKAALGQDHPILVVDLIEGRSPFRCIAAELWGVDNNLNISNMDWEEFAEATGPDGVFRGFR